MWKNISLLICFGLLFCYNSVDAIPEEPGPLNACIASPCGSNVCNPNPCGEHSKCIEIGGRPSCSCDESQDTPDSKIRCKPECIKDEDCSTEKACIKYSCKDPCPGDCGDHPCKGYDHKPYCDPIVESPCKDPTVCQ